MNEMNHYTITRYVSICLNFESTLRVSESVWLWATSARSALHWQFRQADACGASVFPWKARSLQHGGNTVFPEVFFAKGKHVATISNICLEPDVVTYYSVHLPRLFVTKSLYSVNRTVLVLSNTAQKVSTCLPRRCFKWIQIFPGSRCGKKTSGKASPGGTRGVADGRAGRGRRGFVRGSVTNFMRQK